MTGAKSAAGTNWLVSSLAINMVIVNTSTMQLLDTEQRKRSNQPPRDWTTLSGGGADGFPAQEAPPLDTFPKPNTLIPTVMQDSQLVLRKLPSNGDSREVSQLQMETGLSAARVQNAVLQLSQSGLVLVKTWAA